MIDVNLKGTLYTARFTLPHLIESKGDFVSLASVAGLRAFPGEAVYNASKFGMLGFTRALDHELREQGVRVTNIAPGGIATDFAMGSGRTPDCVEGMMSAEDGGRRGAVHGQPAAQPAHDDRLVPADERGVVGLRLGLLSTAHINEKLVAGARLVDEVDVVAVASRVARAGRRRTPPRWASPRALGSYEELLGRPGRRRRLHLAAQLDARGLVGAGARGGQARALREAAGAVGRAGRAGLRRRRRRRPGAGRGVHVAPPPAGAAPGRAAAARGRAARGAGAVLVRARLARTRPRTSACPASSRAGP